MDAIVTAVVGGLLILVVGWLKLDINRLSDKIDHLDERLTAAVNRLSDKIDHLDERLTAAVNGLTERIARLEGRMDEREHRP
jgi:hypothetical protein